MWLIDAISLINMEHSSQSYHKEIKIKSVKKKNYGSNNESGGMSYSK